jgi:hypothetical protein
MKIGWWLFGAAALLACGSSPKTNLIFQVDAPPMEDDGCIGVAGFEVAVTAAGRNAASGPVPNQGTVLTRTSCHLSQSFTIQDVDVDSPASVVVTGSDGAGAGRVEASGRVDNLHGNALHLQLKSTSTPPSTLLVVNRTNLLAGQAQLSAVTKMTILKVKGNATIITVIPGPYFLVEPGAYGVGTSLLPLGGDAPIELAVDMSTAQGTLTRMKFVAMWNPNGYYEAQ